MKNYKAKLKNSDNQKGFSLLITLLVMAVVLVISLAISALMVAEIRLVGAYDDSVAAYYAADAGIEDALLKIANREEITTDTHQELAPNIYYDYPKPTSETDVIDGSLDQDQSVEVGLMENDRPNTVYIYWKDTGTKPCAVEWTLITYTQSGTSITLPKGNIDKGFYPGTGNPADYSDSLNGKPPPGTAYFNSSSISLTETGAHPNKITLSLLTDKKYRYKLRFKCLARTGMGDPSNTTYSLAYKITTGTGDGKMTTGGYTIGSTGTANNVKRKVEVQTDVGRHGMIGIFDYVLYSEDTLYKPSL